jgi:hypothetical protein
MTSLAKPTNWMVILAVGLIVLVASCLYAEWAARRAVERYEQQDFEYWRGRLTPIYEASPDLKYSKEPKTKDELFDPLFRLATPVR